METSDQCEACGRFAAGGWTLLTHVAVSTECRRFYARAVRDAVEGALDRHTVFGDPVAALFWYVSPVLLAYTLNIWLFENVLHASPFGTGSVGGFALDAVALACGLALVAAMHVPVVRADG